MDILRFRDENGKFLPSSPNPLAVSGVYQITNTVTGECYIGSSKNILVRWGEHKKVLRKAKSGAPPLQRAWTAYGEEAFTVSVLEETASDKATLYAREQHYMDTLKPAYNSTIKSNSHLGVKRSEEMREKMRQREYSAETRAKMSQSRRGKKPTEEQRIAHLAKVQSPEHREKLRIARAKRPPASEESRAKMRAAQKINNNKPGAREKQRQAQLARYARKRMEGKEGI